MAVSHIEEKILGRLAKDIEVTNPLLAASLYQVLGLSILLSKKLYRARKLRKLDSTRDTKSLQLYHHIIWLAREGLSITEVYILPYCQNGQHGSECRVMVAKLRASLYHIFCLFHNHPPVSQLSARSAPSASPPSNSSTRKDASGTKISPTRSPKKSKDGSSRQVSGKGTLRDPVSSLQSDESFVTNPYAAGHTPPPGLAVLPPDIPRRTPSRPPGLAPINISAAQSAASFLLPPLNFVPMAKEHFETAQHLANNLLPVTHALRLSVSLEHAAFLWDCAKEYDRSRKLAKRAIRDVYTSSDGLDDDEFADASTLVQALGGIVKRASTQSSPPPPQPTPSQAPTSLAPRDPPRKIIPPIDRTIPVSPPNVRRSAAAPLQSINRSSSSSTPMITTTHHHHPHLPRPTTIPSPDRLSTVPEADIESSSAAPTEHAFSPPASRLSSRSHPRRTSSATSAASDKASKRKIVEQAEEDARERRRRESQAEAVSAAAKRPPRAGGVGGSKSTKQDAPTTTAAAAAAGMGKRDHAGASGGGGGIRQSSVSTEGYVRRSSIPKKPRSEGSSASGGASPSRDRKKKKMMRE